LHVFGHIHEARGAHSSVGPRRCAQYARQRANYESRRTDHRRRRGADSFRQCGESSISDSGPNVQREYAGGVGFQPICWIEHSLRQIDHHTGKYTSIIWKCLLQATLYRVYIRRHVKFNLTPRWTLGRSREIHRELELVHKMSNTTLHMRARHIVASAADDDPRERNRWFQRMEVLPQSR
jgi:hypothetical protein